MSEPGWVAPVATTAAVGTGLLAGVFFAFSGVVMPALRSLPAPDAVRTMQSINRAAVHPPLMIALFGTAATSIAVAVPALRSLDETWARWTLTAGVLYLVAGIVVTVAANVPRNEHLAALDPDIAGSAWAGYLSGWTRWNHVRALGSAAACLCFVLGRRAG